MFLFLANEWDVCRVYLSWGVAGIGLGLDQTLSGVTSAECETTYQTIFEINIGVET